MGKFSVPVTITLDETNPAVDDLTFIISGDNITLSIDENIPDFISGMGYVYPNPVFDKANIEYTLNKSAVVHYTVTDILGRVIAEQTKKSTQGNNNITIDTRNFENGIYYIFMEFDNSFVVSRKFVKTK
jgi:hypothetical protein